MASVNDLIRELREEGESAGTGFFTLDRKKAREKMKKYQLPDPYFYVLELIQAAVCSMASKIDIYIDSDDFIIKFDGLPFSAEALETVYSSLFVSQEDRGLERFRELAIGLNSASELNPRFILISSGDGRSSVTMKITSPDEEEISQGPPGFCGTSVHVKERPGVRTAGKFIRSLCRRSLFFNTSRQPTEEGRIIEERGRYVGIPLTINGKIINKEIDIGETLAKKEINKGDYSSLIGQRSEGFSGEIGLPAGSIEESKVLFLKSGVIIAEKSRKLSKAQVIGVIRCDHLVKNVSQSDIVENNDYHLLWKALHKISLQLITRLIEDYGALDENKKQRARSFLMKLASENLGVAQYSSRIAEWRLQLAALPLFGTIQGEPVSLEELIEQHRKIGHLPFSLRSSKCALRDNLKVVLLSSELDMKALIEIFGNQTENAEAKIEEAERRDKNIKMWEMLKKEPLLSPGYYLVRLRFEAGACNGEIAIPLGAAGEKVSIMFMKNLSPIACEEIRLLGLYLVTVVNNDSLNPLFTWDGVEKDAIYEETINTLLNQLDPLFFDLVKIYPNLTLPGEIESARTQIINYLNYLINVNRGLFPGRFSLSPASQKSGKGEIAEMQLPPGFTSLKLFRATGNRILSIEELKKIVETSGHFPYLSKEPAGALPEDITLLLLNEVELQFLKRHMGDESLSDYKGKVRDLEIAWKNRNRMEEAPSLHEECMVKARVREGDMEGEIGLPYQSSLTFINPYKDYRWSADLNSRIRLLKHRRLIIETDLSLACGAVIGVINCDDLKVNPTYDDVESEEVLKDLAGALELSLGDLALETARNFQSVDMDREMGRKFLLRFIIRKAGGSSARLTEASGDEILEKIKDAFIFETIWGRHISFRDMMNIFKAQKVILLSTKGVKSQPPEGLEVIRASSFEKSELSEIFGQFRVQEYVEGALQSVTDGIIPRIVEKAELGPEALLCRVKIEEEGIEGEIGFPDCFDRTSVYSDMRFLKEYVDLGKKHVVFDACVAGVVNYNKLTPLFRADGVVEDKNFKLLISTLALHIDLLVRKLLDAYGALDAGKRKVASLHLLNYFASCTREKKADAFVSGVCSPGISRFSREFMELIGSLSAGEAPEAPSDLLLKEIMEIPAFLTIDGKNVSLNALVQNQEKYGQVFYIERASEKELGGEPLDHEKIVLLITKEEYELLKRIFGALSNYEGSLELDNIARANMGREKLTSLKVPRENALAVTRVKRGQMTGELALSLDRSRPAGVVFSKGLIPVIEKEVKRGIVLIGNIENPEFEVNRTWDDVTLTSGQQNYINKCVERLFEHLYAHMKTGQVAKEYLEAARDYMLDYVLSRKELLFDTQPGIFVDELLRDILTLKMLDTADGRKIGIDRALDMLRRCLKLYYIFDDEKVPLPDGELLLKVKRDDNLLTFFRALTGIEGIVHYYPGLIIERELPKIPVEQEPYKSNTVESSLEIALKERARSIQESGQRALERALETAWKGTVDRQDEMEESLQSTEAFEVSRNAPIDSGVSTSGVEGPQATPRTSAEPEVPESSQISGAPAEMHVARETSDKKAAAPESSQTPLTGMVALLLNVQKELRIIKELDEYKLSDAMIANIFFAYLRNRDIMVEYSHKERKTVINLANPTVNRIVNNFERLPHLMYYIISAIYSAINYELSDVTDEDEIRFQTRLMENYLPGKKS